ncbi:hypothetical protein [Methylomagnum sp.]
MSHASPTHHPIAPRLVCTVGLHGSASTYLFNIARELIAAAFGTNQVLAFYTESVAEALRTPGLAGRRAVWKLHCGDELWRPFAHVAAPRVLVSIRDPRDGVASLMQRFNAGFQPSVRALERDCALALSCAEAGYPVFDYADGFFQREDTVARIAAYLGLDLPAERLQAIHAAFDTDSVRDHAARLMELPEGRRGGDGVRLLMDKHTQIHRNHVLDGRAGRWRDVFGEAECDFMAAQFRPFLDRFYPD